MRGTKINSSTIFEGCYLNLRGKKFEIHKHSWLLIICIFNKLNSIQTLVKDIPEIILSHWSLLSKTYKKSHLITGPLIALNKFVFYPNNYLVPLRNLSYQESTVAAPIPSIASYIYTKFSFLSAGLQYRFYFKIYSQCRLWRLPIQKNQWNFCTVQQKAII